MFTQAAAGRLRLPDGAVVVIEDVTEAAYRVDRMLTALLVGGAFDLASAVVVGDFTECPPSRGITVDQVIAERLAELRVPVLTGLGFGHGERNLRLVFGVPAAVDGRARSRLQSTRCFLRVARLQPRRPSPRRRP